MQGAAAPSKSLNALEEEIMRPITACVAALVLLPVVAHADYYDDDGYETVPQDNSGYEQQPQQPYYGEAGPQINAEEITDCAAFSS